MSYDIDFFKPDPPMRRLEDHPHVTYSSMGSPDEVRGLLSQIFPALRWNPADRIWGVLMLDEALFEFQIDTDNPVRMVCLHMSFRTGDKYGIVRRICNATGWSAIDGQVGAEEVLFLPQNGNASGHP